MIKAKQVSTAKLLLDQILNTAEQEIISDKEFSELISSFLNILILPKQIALNKKAELYYEFRKQYLSSFKIFEDILKKQDIHLSDTNGSDFTHSEFYIKKSVNGKDLGIDKVPVDLFMRRLRNGIVHFGYESFKNENAWYGILIRNYFQNSSNVNFEVFFTIKDLQKLIKFLGETYRTYIPN